MYAQTNTRAIGFCQKKTAESLQFSLPYNSGTEMVFFLSLENK